MTLSPLTVGDVAAHIAGEDAELVRWLTGGPEELERTTAYFRMCEAQWDAGGGSPLAFGIRTGDPLTLGLAEAVLRMEPENTASVAVAERAGFTHIRTSDEHEGVLMHLYTRKLDS